MTAPGSLVAQSLSPEMLSPLHTALIRPNLYGQYRVQLTSLLAPDPGAPEGHGSIVRELCTYSRTLAGMVLFALASTPDPEGLCRSWERPWNCEYPGGRIRLDNTEADRPETVDAAMPRFACPTCGLVSYHPRDIQERYCVRCHKFHEGE